MKMFELGRRSSRIAVGEAGRALNKSNGRGDRRTVLSEYLADRLEPEPVANGVDEFD